MVKRSCRIGWLEHHEFARHHWDRCACGKNFYQRMDDDGHYYLAILDRFGAYVLESPTWYSRLDRVLYRAVASDSNEKIKGFGNISDHRLSICYKIMDHDDAFRKDLQGFMFLENMFFTKNNDDCDLITIKGDKAYSLQIR